MRLFHRCMMLQKYLPNFKSVKFVKTALYRQNQSHGVNFYQVSSESGDLTPYRVRVLLGKKYY